jgi:hypothetical protein
LFKAEPIIEISGVIVGRFVNLRIITIEHLHRIGLDGIFYDQKVERFPVQWSTIKGGKI